MERRTYGVNSRKNPQGKSSLEYRDSLTSHDNSALIAKMEEMKKNKSKDK